MCIILVRAREKTVGKLAHGAEGCIVQREFFLVLGQEGRAKHTGALNSLDWNWNW